MAPLTGPNNCIEMKCLYSVRTLLLVLLGIPAFAIAQKQLMPLPQTINYGTGKFPLANARMLNPKNLSVADQKAINQFLFFVKENTGITIAATNSQEVALPLLVFNCTHRGAVLPLPNETTGKQSREAYQLHVTPKKI